jgi:predicted metal-dependent HD superfamily phosphohydrolase
MDSDLIKKAKTYAEQVFRSEAFHQRTFHNLAHTTHVVKAAEEIGIECTLSHDALESVIIAAWLHDTGYDKGAADHEIRSADAAGILLESWQADPKKIYDITEAIRATKMPQQPISVISKVLCDADLHDLSTENCEESSRKLRKEWELTEQKFLDDKKWIQDSIEFMQHHSYHTHYGQNILEPGKSKNIHRFKKLLSEY